MDRRSFLKKSGIVAVGAGLALPLGIQAAGTSSKKSNSKTAKNIIFLVSDGMSSGTLNMADLLLKRKEGRQSNWINLYQENKVSRALMETSSADSIVTDSAAASSAWGGGIKVNNNALNVGPNGELPVPILQKFKALGKSVGCVTTVPITHATPAGFCINAETRKNQDVIAEKYLPLKFDVMLGGGLDYFSAETRKDKRDLLGDFKTAGYQVVLNKKELNGITDFTQKIQPFYPILGLFAQDALPYSVDYNIDKTLQEKVPTLAEMTKFAIEQLSKNQNGFVLQVEGGKVDWAAHGNDIGGLLYDQIAFDDAIKVAMDFAERDENTLVIITTDHGNSNPGIIYGDEANKNFDKVQLYKSSNTQILSAITPQTTAQDLIGIFEDQQQWILDKVIADDIIKIYQKLTSDDIKNYRHLPFETIAQIQTKNNSIGWISNEHSADYVELALFGPGSELLTPFIKNTDLHQIMLKATGV